MHFAKSKGRSCLQKNPACLQNQEKKCVTTWGIRTANGRCIVTQMKKNPGNSKYNNEGDSTQSKELSVIRSGVVKIPVDFSDDLPLCFPIEIQLQNSMNNSTIMSEKPLLPGLFQLIAQADKPESVPILRRALTMSRVSLAEMSLDSERLEEVLNAMAKKKKSERRTANPSKNFAY